MAAPSQASSSLTPTENDFFSSSSDDNQATTSKFISQNQTREELSPLNLVVPDSFSESEDSDESEFESREQSKPTTPSAPISSWLKTSRTRALRNRREKLSSCIDPRKMRSSFTKASDTQLFEKISARRANTKSDDRNESLKTNIFFLKEVAERMKIKLVEEQLVNISSDTVEFLVRRYREQMLLKMEYHEHEMKLQIETFKVIREGIERATS